MRIGLIGCGNHARNSMVPALKTVDGVELAACADADEVAAHAAVRDLGFERPYLDYRDMLSRESLDGVMIVTPHHALKDAVVAAVESGCPVLVEKPMAVSRVEAEEIRTAARRAGVPVMVAFCLRYAEGRKTMKALIDRGAVGDIVLVNGAKSGSVHPLDSWRSKPDMGGGQLLWIGVHITDQVLWMVGSEPQRVQSEINWNPQTGADENTAFTVRFKNDVIASVLCSQGIAAGYQVMDYIEVIGSNGRIRADWPSNVVQVHSRTLPEYSHPTTIRPQEYLNAEMYAAEVRDWTDSLSQKSAPPITDDDGANVLQIIDAVFESGRTGMPVTLS